MEKCISCGSSKDFTITKGQNKTDIQCKSCHECVIRIINMSEGSVELEVAEEYIGLYV